MTDLARNAKHRHLLEAGLWGMWNRAVSRPELEKKANALMTTINGTESPPFLEAKDEAVVIEYLDPGMKKAYQALFGF